MIGEYLARFRFTLSIALCAGGITLLLASPSHAGGPDRSAFEPGKELATRAADRRRAATPMERCMATWNRASQMSKDEWRRTCKRVVKTNPDLYGKPF
jgi:hypothetical protein